MLIDMSVSAGVLIVLTIILEKIDGNYFALCDGIHQYDHACDI